MTPTHPTAKYKEGITELRAALKQARDCIEDLGAGRGGWAWEEVIDVIDQASSFVTRLESNLHDPKTVR